MPNKSQERKKVNSDRDIISISVELTPMFLLCEVWSIINTEFKLVQKLDLVQFQHSSVGNGFKPVMKLTSYGIGIAIFINTLEEKMIFSD